jgi:trimeric autotransporter adhesin
MEDMRMDSLDNFRERLDALEQQTKVMEVHTHTVERRLRRWRGMAGSLLVLGLLSWALPSGKAADTQPRGMAERMATLEKKLAAMDFDDAANEVVISGANLRIVNGLGTTETTNGLGNLIVGYNELRQDNPDCEAQFGQLGACRDIRRGSHNMVVGKENNFASFGGMVIGLQNQIAGDFSAVSGGVRNLASGTWSAISGGMDNLANGFAAAVSAGPHNTASGDRSSVSGGRENTASGSGSSVSGGALNTASGDFSSVSGGVHNTASGQSSISGGENNTASGLNCSISGGLANTASGIDCSISGGNSNIATGVSTSVSGGENNTASGSASSVSGGLNRTAPAANNWAAGALFSDQ